MPRCAATQPSPCCPGMQLQTTRIAATPPNGSGGQWTCGCTIGGCRLQAAKSSDNKSVAGRPAAAAGVQAANTFCGHSAAKGLGRGCASGLGGGRAAHQVRRGHAVGLAELACDSAAKGRSAAVGLISAPTQPNPAPTSALVLASGPF